MVDEFARQAAGEPTRFARQPVIDWHSLPVDEVLSKLKSSSGGLADEEAKKRLELYGKNELKEARRRSKQEIFFSQFKNLLVAVLIAASVISYALGEVLDGSAIAAIVILNAFLGYAQENKAERALEALKKMAAPQSVALRNGKKILVDSKTLVPGDVIFLESGSKVPADCRILEEMNLKIDESVLTGESKPVRKQIDAVSNDCVVADRKCMAFSGTAVVYGRCMAVASETGMKTEFGKIAQQLSEPDEETPLQKKLDVLGKQLGMMILVVCAIVFAVGFLRNNPVLEMFLVAVSLAVAAIPEGLPAVVTITLAIGLMRMSRKRALMRNLPASETLGSATVICSDKTGTITQNKMTVQKIFFSDKIHDVGKKQEDNSLFEIGVLCNDASWPEENSNIGDPTEAALLASANKHSIGDIRKKYKRISEIPFESSRKMMSVVCIIDKGKRAMYTKGAVESVLEKCTHVYKDHGAVKINDKERKHILAANMKLSQSALRVLAFAYKHCESKSDEGKEEGLIFVGLQGMMDPPRPEVKDAISMCTKAGIKVVMITGDHRETAVAIAEEIGMSTKKILVGTEMDSMNDASFEKIVDDVSVYARVSPEHKVRITEALRKNGHIVAMTGDGVNDAPALKKADIGIAVGSGTDVTKEAADMVLIDDNFATVVSAVEEGRAIYENIKKFVYYLLSANLGEVLVVFVGILIGWPIVLLPLMLLWINILTDGLPALALGVEPPDAGAMSRPPRNPKENILNQKSLMFIIAVAAIMAFGTLLQFYSELPGSMDANGVGSLALARTSAFTQIVLFELVLALSMRSQLPLRKIGLLSNKKMILAMLSSFALQLVVIYTPLNVIFGTVPLGLADWIEIAAVSLSILVVLEAWKTVQCRKRS